MRGDLVLGISMECLQVRQHDVLVPSGNACVVEMKGVPGSHRVCCLELFGSVTIIEVQWHWGHSCAVLQPISVHKEAGWVRACLPMSEDTVLAGVHEQYLAVLRTEEKGPDWQPPEAPRVAGVKMDRPQLSCSVPSVPSSCANKCSVARCLAASVLQYLFQAEPMHEQPLAHDHSSERRHVCCAGLGAAGMDDSVISGFNAALPQQSAPPTDPRSPGASLQAPTCAGASAMLTGLCCNLRQGITQMAHMRSCVWCAGMQSSEDGPMAVFVTNAGGIGLVQQLPEWLTGPLCTLQDMLAGAHRSSREQGPVWPPRASAHHHRSTWCSYTYKEPFCNERQWQLLMTALTDELYTGGPVTGFSAQSMAVDAELLKMWVLHAEENGMHIRRSSNENSGKSSLSQVPWRAIRALNYLRVFGLMYVPHVRSLEQELVKL